jgi:hypothetical protein
VLAPAILEHEERSEMSKRSTSGFLTLVFSLAGFLAVAPARAAVEENDKLPIELVIDIPCANDGAGETVTLTGNLHIVMTAVINGNKVQGKYHFQPQGVSGYGSITGDRYQATGVTQGQFKASMQNGQAHVTSENNFRIIGQGPGNNFLVHENLHLTINANGDVTTAVDHLGIDCK